MNELTLESISRAIKDEIRRSAEGIYEKQKQEMIEKLENDKDKIVTSTILKISKHISVTTMGNKVVVEIIKLPDKQEA